jgi:predicted PurR-regulated permease PerM
MPPSLRLAFLLLLLVGITAAFVAMVWPFLLTILLAAVLTGIAYPAYRRVLGTIKHPPTAAIVTLLLLLAMVFAPLLSVLGAAANQALGISETIGPRLQEFINTPGEFDRRLSSLPGYQYIAPYRDEILTRAGALIGSLGAFLFDALSATTRATVLFVFHFFVLLYTMYFFLTGGPRLLERSVAYLPLNDAEKEQMLDKFVSVTRATLKSTLVIGGLQGLLGGFAFWVIGIEGAIFWGVVMTVLSIIPGVGGALVWVPAAIVLVAEGEIARGLGLALFSSLFIGSVDNVLRPMLIGRDTRMHELLIFFSTLGGLMLFGATGFIVGPILAALFLTVWEMFGSAFRLARPLVVPASDDEARLTG